MIGRLTSYTHVSEVSGPTHTGSGDQYNIKLISAEQQRRTASGLWSTKHLDWLEQRFVAPSEFDKVSAALDERKAVSLLGPRGSGRRTTAMMLLLKETEHRPRGTRFHELFPAEVDGDPDWDAPELVEHNSRLLLDLTSVDEAGLRQVEKGLLEFRGVVEAGGAFLVIVARDDSAFNQSAADLDCRITTPDREKTLIRYLEVAGIREPLSSLLPQPDQLAKLGSWPMSGIHQLVELTCAVRDGEPSLGPRGWLERAFKALTDDGATVAERVSVLELAPQRALHVSAAMLSGATADAADAAAEDLLKIIGHPTTTRAVLDSPNFAERLEEVGARIDVRRKLRFEDFALDVAVLGYYWDAFPDLREHLATWMDRIIRYEQLTSADRSAVVARYSVQSLRTDRTADLAKLIERWTDGKPGTRRLELSRYAMMLLDDGLAHESHGRQFRQQIYTWSAKESSIHPDLAAVLIGACLGRLAESHPEQALVRLHHFARRDGEVGELGLEALTRFVEEDDRRLRRLLSRITSPTGPNSADARVFLRVVDVRRLTADRRRSQPLLNNRYVRGQLVGGWRLVLSQPSVESQAALNSWFLMAAVNVASRDLLLAVLVTASDGFSSASLLEAAAHAWAATTDDEMQTCRPTQRVELARRLIAALDRRQQSETPQAPPSAPYREQHPPTTPPVSEAFE
jgi:hypothetical protein